MEWDSDGHSIFMLKSQGERFLKREPNILSGRMQIWSIQSCTLVPSVKYSFAGETSEQCSIVCLQC